MNTISTSEYWFFPFVLLKTRLFGEKETSTMELLWRLFLTLPRFFIEEFTELFWLDWEFCGLNLHSTSYFFSIVQLTGCPFLAMTPISSKLMSNLYFLIELTSIVMVCSGSQGFIDSLTLWLSLIEPSLLACEMLKLMISSKGCRGVNLHIKVISSSSRGVFSSSSKGVWILICIQDFILLAVLDSSHSI